MDDQLECERPVSNEVLRLKVEHVDNEIHAQGYRESNENQLKRLKIFKKSGEHGVVVRAFGLYWGGSRFESLLTHHCGP